jgi:hypothetical protein
MAVRRGGERGTAVDARAHAARELRDEHAVLRSRARKTFDVCKILE